VAVKIGSLLIEVASGVARVESDMQKISKILDGNTKAWTKMFNVVKVAAGGWLAHEVLREGINKVAEGMRIFGEAGMRGASAMKEHAAAVTEYRQRQAELTAEAEKFAGGIVGPMVKTMSNFTILLRDTAKASQEVTKGLGSIANMMPSFSSMVKNYVLGSVALPWNLASQAVGLYAESVRNVEKKQAEKDKDPLIAMLPTEEDMAFDDEVHRLKEERERLRNEI